MKWRIFLRHDLLAKSINVVFSNMLFHFSYETMNASNAKITFLWNICHLFPVLFYEWNSHKYWWQFLIFWGFFSWIVSWKGASLFKGHLFLGLPIGVSVLIGGVKKSGEAPSPWSSLVNPEHRTITKNFIRKVISV